MRSLSSHLLRTLMALAGFACAFASAQQLPVPVAAPAATARQFLWEVSSLTNRVYLYGTIHAGKAAWYPLPDPVEKALQDSRVLVVEADVTNLQAMAKSAPAMMYAPPDRLDKHVAPADYARLKKLVGRFKLPEEQVAQMKPFMAVSLVVFSEWGRLGYLPQYGVDGYLIGKAKAEAKRIVEIEGIEAQMALMDSLSEQEQLDVFKGTLDAFDRGLTAEQITGMVNAWQTGDPALLLEVARKYNTEIPGAKAFEEKFIWSRHEPMVKKIEGYLATKDRHFIAVGALHLAGERGLVEMLKARGYVVKQL